MPKRYSAALRSLLAQIECHANAARVLRIVCESRAVRRIEDLVALCCDFWRREHVIRARNGRRQRTVGYLVFKRPPCHQTPLSKRSAAKSRLKVNWDRRISCRANACRCDSGGTRSHDRAKCHQDLWLSGSEIDLNGRGFCFPLLSVGPARFAAVICLYRRGRDFCEA
jgi:hypothetical protein